MTAHDAYVRQFNLWVPRDCVASGSAAYTRAALTQLQRVVNAVTVPSSAKTLPRLN
jgi:hypothetical protein